jgi:hypothetical protein
MADDKKHNEPSERELAMMNAFAQSMRTTLEPLVSKIAELEARVNPPPPAKLSADEVHAKLMSTLRGQLDEVREIGLVEVVECCTSDLGAPDGAGVMRGATFDVEVHYKPVLIDGKIVGKSGTGTVKTLINYRYPDGFDRHIKDGGVVPEGMEIHDQSKEGAERAGYGQWLAETFWQADLKRFCGRALPPHVRPPAVVQGVPVKTGT